MSITKASGTQIAVASTYGSSVSMTAISNATSAVMTLAAAHGVVVGDFLEITSGWDLLNSRVFRVSVVATNDITLEGLNTTNTSLYPAGSGIGSIRRITAWTPITQVTQNLQVTGGDQNYANITGLSDTIEKQMPTTRSPIKVTIPLYDDPTLAFYDIVRAISETSAAAAVRMVFPNASRLVANANWSLQTVPTIEDSTLRGSIDLSFLSTPTRYGT